MPTACYELVISGLHYGQHVENVLAFIGDPADGTQSLAEATDLIESWQGGAQDQWLDCLPPTYQIIRYSARKLKPAGPSNVAHKLTVNNALIGTRGTEAQSDNLCPAITTIPPMGIKSPGRIYMPCIAKESIENNAYVASYGTAISTLMAALLAGISGTAITWVLAIYSPKNDTAVSVQQYVLSPAIGFQGRRRRPL